MMPSKHFEDSVSLRERMKPKSKPLTPPRGQPMPQTQEYWEKRAQDDQEVILRQRKEIARLCKRVNQLEQRLDAEAQ